jgi:hypothetical protein
LFLFHRCFAVQNAGGERSEPVLCDEERAARLSLAGGVFFRRVQNAPHRDAPARCLVVRRADFSATVVRVLDVVQVRGRRYLAQRWSGEGLLVLEPLPASDGSLGEALACDETVARHLTLVGAYEPQTQPTTQAVARE